MTLSYRAVGSTLQGMAVPVSNSQRIVCAVRRTGVSPTVLRAALVRDQYVAAGALPVRRLWNALADDAGVEHPDRIVREEVLRALLFLSADEINTASAEVVADILLRQAALTTEGVDQ